MHKLEKSDMHIDKTINVGQILTMLVIVASVIAGYYSVYYDIKMLRTLHDHRLDRLENSNNLQSDTNRQMLEALNSIKVDIAVMRSKFDAVEGSPKP